MPSTALFVSVPIASFRNPRAREYLETLPAPPPATVYGMLLSLVGERRRLRHAGAQIALALLSSAPRSRVLRSVWRVKTSRSPLGLGENKRPDFQELLTDVRLAVHVRDGESEQEPSLAARVAAAIRTPAAVSRFGGLALGESTHLVNALRELRDQDATETTSWLVRDSSGLLALPVWPDHVGSAGTRFEQFSLLAATTNILTPPAQAWTTITPP
jgi:CRISPR-associated protein Cas5t